MTNDLAERLLDLAAAVDDLPAAEREAMARALCRFERDRWIRLAASHAGGCAGLVEALGRDGWRIDTWRARGRCPPHVGPLLTALYNAAEAAPLPTSAKQLRRIVQGHDMSLDCAFTDA